MNPPRKITGKRENSAQLGRQSVKVAETAEELGLAVEQPGGKKAKKLAAKRAAAAKRKAAGAKVKPAVYNVDLQEGISINAVVSVKCTRRVCVGLPA